MRQVLKFMEWKQQKISKAQHQFLLTKINEISAELIKNNRGLANWVVYGGAH